MEQVSSGSKKMGIPYWEVPADVVEDAESLKDWADKSYQAAVNAKKVNSLLSSSKNRC